MIISSSPLFFRCESPSMAAEDGGKSPAHPRRRTPDHPPYAVMIAAAIQSSSEEGGSTMEAISRYIRSHYDGLPDGHDRLLPYYLGRLTAQGEFVMPEPGRFLVAAAYAGAEPALGSRPDRAPPSSLSRPADDDRGTAESPPAMGRDSDRPTESQNGEGSSEARPAESMLECRDGGNVEFLEYVLGLPWEGPPVTATATATATANEGDGSDPVPKRRGRPPKNKPVVVDNAGVRSETGGEDQQKKDGSDDEKGRDEPGPKRRGRPPKNKPALIDNSGVASETRGGADGKGQDEPEPKRRGRPPKNKPVLIDNCAVGSASVPKRRRGRPPKRNTPPN